MNDIAWAVLGMVGYSIVTLLVKLATRTGDFNAFAVLAIATTIVAIAALTNAGISGSFAGKSLGDFVRPGACRYGRSTRCEIDPGGHSTQPRAQRRSTSRWTRLPLCGFECLDAGVLGGAAERGIPRGERARCSQREF